MILFLILPSLIELLLPPKTMLLSIYPKLEDIILSSPPIIAFCDSLNPTELPVNTLFLPTKIPEES